MHDSTRLVMSSAPIRDASRQWNAKMLPALTQQGACRMGAQLVCASISSCLMDRGE